MLTKIRRALVNIFCVLAFISVASAQRVDTIWMDGQKVIVHSELLKDMLHGNRTFKIDGKVYLLQRFQYGIMHGIEKWFDPKTGLKEAEIPFVDGRVHGVRKEWKDDKLIKESYFINGIQVTEMQYYQLKERS